MKSERYLLVDSFRGIASCWILCFHILPHYIPSNGIVLSIIKFGRIGTDFFFVASGFVVALACNKILTVRKGDFIFKRMQGIYSLYLYSLLLAIVILPILMAFVSFLKSHQLVFEFTKLNIFEILEYVTLTKVFTAESWSLNKAFVDVNGNYWFIAIIVQIYIFISITLKFGRYFKMIIVAMFILSLLCLIPEIKGMVPIGLFIPHFSKFFFGMLLWYFIYPNSHLINKSVRTALVTFNLFIFFVILNHHRVEGVGGDIRVLYALFISILLLLLHPFDSKIANTRFGTITNAFGKMSYSMYLNHVVLWPFMYMFVSNLVPLPINIAAPFVLVPSVVISCFIFYSFFQYSNNPIKAFRTPVMTIRNAYKSLIN